MTEKLRHPAGLKILFFTEMWERFGFYLMLGILPLYLSDHEKGGMGWSDKRTAVVVGSYIALVYFTPFIGGLIADRLLGFRKTIVLGAILMMTGYFLMAIPTETGLYVALAVIILGNGAFKPNISTLLGRLYPPGSPLKDAGYNIFYMGINIGAFFCNFVAAYVRNYFDNHPEFGIRGWNAAFSTAGLGMLIGLLTFLVNYRRFETEDPDPRLNANQKESLTPLWVQCLIPAAVIGGLGWFIADWAGKTYSGFPLNAPTAAFLGACLPVIYFFINIMLSMPTREERGRVAALLVVFAVVIIFWGTFHLNTTALSFWARDDTNRVPSGVVRTVTDLMPEFAENAPPKYFSNAGPDTPRPAKGTFVIVTPEEYKRLEKEKLLSVQDGKKVYVTQEQIDKVYQRAASGTLLLPDGQHLKLFNTEIFSSINAGQVVLFTPLVVAFFAMLRRRNLEPTTPGKMGIGLLINAGAPLLMFLATWASDNSAHKVSAWWLIGTYGVATLGELCLSPMGLSLVSKVSPPQIAAFMMGGYFLSTSFGNKLSGIFGELYTEMDHYTFWIILVICNVACGLAILVLLPWLKRQMGSSLH